MKFSSRVAPEFEPNALARLLADKRAAGVRVLDLTESNPTHAGIRYPEGYLSALAKPEAALYEPESFGLKSAREVAAKAQGVSVDRLILTASTSEAYSWIFKLLCDPGDEVLIPRPSYPLFEYLAALESVRVKSYGLFYDTGAWCIDFHALESAMTERTRAVVLVHPNNPTGHFTAAHELERLRAVCAERGVAIVSDEVFADYALEAAGELRTLGGSESALTFTLHGLSKAVGLPQMKLAWMTVSGAKDAVRPALERLELIADTYLSAGTPVQLALPELLELRGPVQGQIRTRLRDNLGFLRSSGLRVLNVEAGWYAIVSHNEGDGFAEKLLRERDVLTQPGYFYDFEGSGYLVVSLLTEPGVFQEGVGRIAGAVSGRSTARPTE